jgi:hypothetical protein
MKRQTRKGTKASKQTRSALIIGFFILFLAGQTYGQNIDLQTMIQETQKMSKDHDEMTLVWWMPEQFWQASMEQNPAITKAKVDQMLEVIRPYTMIAVVDGHIGTFGGVTYRSEEAVRNSVKIKDAKGLHYDPLNESAVTPDMKNLLQILKPVIVNMTGPMGQNMHFILFQSKSNDGQPIADPTREGILNIVVAGKEFKYRLPLGSILPSKFDSKTGEQFPGNYSYNPFTGSKLITELSNKPLQTTR